MSYEMVSAEMPAVSANIAPLLDSVLGANQSLGDFVNATVEGIGQSFAAALDKADALQTAQETGIQVADVDATTDFASERTGAGNWQDRVADRGGDISLG